MKHIAKVEFHEFSSVANAGPIATVAGGCYSVAVVVALKLISVTLLSEKQTEWAMAYRFRNRSS